MLDFPPVPPEQALVSLVDSPYGFTLVDLELDPSDIALFDQLQIEHIASLNCFGTVDLLQSPLVNFLEQLGDNDHVQAIADCITRIAKKVLDASASPYAWFCLKAKASLDPPLTRRWHMDGLHFTTSEMQVKFCWTPQGPPTLFYLLPITKPHLRQVIWRHQNSSAFTEELLSDEAYFFTPSKEQGVFFILSNPRLSALHTEPATSLSRLFFSLVPCHNEKELKEMQIRVESYIQK